jgi:hypothetical protein
MPSTVVKSFEYHADTSTLRVIYQSGNVYDYKNVPEREYKMMRAAASKGRYLNKHIKTKYEFEQIE